MNILDPLATLKSLLSTPERFEILAAVRSLELQDCWIGAGFIRNAVWDHLHGIDHGASVSDIDVIYFDPGKIGPACDLKHQGQLKNRLPLQTWSVKNQARMHIRNSDHPYSSCLDAISKWQETATSIAARINGESELEVICPFGLDDLFELRVRSTPHFMLRSHVIRNRIDSHGWLERWPNLKIELS